MDDWDTVCGVFNGKFKGVRYLGSRSNGTRAEFFDRRVLLYRNDDLFIDIECFSMDEVRRDSYRGLEVLFAAFHLGVSFVFSAGARKPAEISAKPHKVRDAGERKWPAMLWTQKVHGINIFKGKRNRLSGKVRARYKDGIRLMIREFVKRELRYTC